jgi:subtilisin-like proprotein convertase family protein
VDGDLSVVRGTDHILSFIVENTAGPVTDYSVTFWGPNEPTPGTNPGEWVFDTSTLGSTEYTVIITDGCKRTWYTFELDVTLPPPDVSVVGVAGANTLFAGADTVVTVTFDVTGCAVVEDVRLVLDATHEYRGDIIVELAAPSAEELLIKDATFDGTDDINGTFSADSTGYFLVPTMATYFDGVVGDGTWTLTLTDDWPSSDDGSFNSATLELFCQ